MTKYTRSASFLIVFAAFSLCGSVSAQIVTVEGQKHYRFGGATKLIVDGLYLSDAQVRDLLRQAERVYNAGEYSEFRVIWDTFDMVYSGPLKGEVLAMCVRAHYALLVRRLQEIAHVWDPNSGIPSFVFYNPDRQHPSKYIVRGAEGPLQVGTLSIGYVNGYGSLPEFLKSLNDTEIDITGTRTLIEMYLRKVSPEDPYISQGRLQELISQVVNGINETEFKLDSSIRQYLAKSVEKYFNEVYLNQMSRRVKF